MHCEKLYTFHKDTLLKPIANNYWFFVRLFFMSIIMIFGTTYSSRANSVLTCKIYENFIANKTRGIRKFKKYNLKSYNRQKRKINEVIVYNVYVNILTSGDIGQSTIDVLNSEAKKWFSKNEVDFDNEKFCLKIKILFEKSKIDINSVEDEINLFKDSGTYHLIFKNEHGNSRVPTIVDSVTHKIKFQPLGYIFNKGLDAETLVKTVLHETCHFIGLPDMYVWLNGETIPDSDFENDIMGTEYWSEIKKCHFRSIIKHLIMIKHDHNEEFHPDGTIIRKE